MNIQWSIRLFLVIALGFGGYFYFITDDEKQSSSNQTQNITEDDTAIEDMAGNSDVDLASDLASDLANVTNQNGTQTAKQNEIANVTEPVLEPAQLEGQFENQPVPQFGRVESLVQQIRNSLVDVTGGVQEKRFQLKQTLLDTVLNDGEALSVLISAFKNYLYDPAMAFELQTVLSEVKDPEVEQLAVDLTQSGIRSELLTGLDLLGALAIPNESTLNRVKQIIEQNQYDPQLLLTALQAIHPVILPADERSQMLQTLNTMTNHEDESVRSASLFAIGKWAKDASQLQPVIAALDSQVIDERISAAMVIENSPVVSPDLKLKLIYIMSDETQLWEVRIMAANSMKRFELNSNEYQLYKHFQDQLTLDTSG